MSTEDFIIDLFCRIDDAMKDLNKHSQAILYPSEIVTLAILFAIKGVGNRAFYRWLNRDWRPLFLKLPHRTRLFRLFKVHKDWANRFLADPTVLGVIDSYEFTNAKGLWVLSLSIRFVRGVALDRSGEKGNPTTAG